MTGQFSWNNISLGKYAEIDALSKAVTDKSLANDVTMLSIITGKSEEYFTDDINLLELKEWREKLHKFLATEIHEKYYPVFKCNGRKYKVSETMAEYNGAQLEAISALKITPETFASVAHKAVAILCNEKRTWKFWRKPLTIEKRWEDFEKHLPASIGLGITGFFFLYSQALYEPLMEKISRETQKLVDQINQSQPSDQTE